MRDKLSGEDDFNKIKSVIVVLKSDLKEISIIKNAFFIFITGFSLLHANKSAIVFYKEGMKIENTTVKMKETSNAAENSIVSKRAIRDEIIKYAQSKLGSRYVWGATGPNNFDCSGFVQYVFKRSAGVLIPRVSSDQADYRPRLLLMNVKKGDLLFFETTGKGRISHVGIYMGERQFIHASSGSGKVMISSLDTDYYMKSFRWGGDMI